MANATQQQLDEIKNAVMDGAELLDEMMQELVNKVGGLEPKGASKLEKAKKRLGLICLALDDDDDDDDNED